MKKENKIIYKEPKGYFSPEMLKAAKEFDKKQKELEKKEATKKK